MYPASEWRVVSGRMMMIRAVTNFGVSFRSMLLFATQQFAKPHADANFVENICRSFWLWHWLGLSCSPC
jgi:hypothetical protein